MTVILQLDKDRKEVTGVSANERRAEIIRIMVARRQESMQVLATELGVSQVTVSNNNSRLIRELSMRLFPDQVIGELFL